MLLFYLLNDDQFHAVKNSRAFDYSQTRKSSFFLQTSLIFMGEIQVLFSTNYDPSSEAIKDLGSAETKEYVHIRLQRRINGRKSLTKIQGLRKEFSYDKILKDLKKELYCYGNVVHNRELGKVIQLQGDHRINVADFLISAGIANSDQIQLHI